MNAAAYISWLAKAPLRPEVIDGVRAMPAIAAGGGIARPQVEDRSAFRGWGGYGEDRSIYTQKLFAPEGEEPRTLHLGIDIFAPADIDVMTPVDGKVHSFRVNDNPGDYGPTIILEHRPAPGLLFHTLYGHLSRASLKGLKPGEVFMAGERIASLGARTENGGWPPHLHFQVLLDIGSAKGDYPGVCKRSERDHWLSICPDPAVLLGLPAH